MTVVPVSIAIRNPSTPLLAADPGESLLFEVLPALMLVIAAARIGGWLFARLGQPQVVGEIVAGLLLGPSALGRLAPQFVEGTFSPDVAPILLVLGQLGLIFLMFVVGLEFDFGHLARLGGTAAGVAVAGIVLPFGLGALLAWLVHADVAAEHGRAGFVLFVATALSITAIPILGRIMLEFGLTRTPVGALTISAAAVDDALGWILLAAVSASVRGGFELGPVIGMLALTTGFVLVVLLGVGPLFRRWGERVVASNAGNLPLLPFSIVILAMLGSAVLTTWIGVFSIFGPFVLGAALSGEGAFPAAIRNRVEPFVTAFLLPVFFTYTGLRTNVGSLESLSLWIVCGLLLSVAVTGKVIGCGLAARLGGMSWRDSSCVAVMMNTRALMGLIAVNVGRDLGVIPDTVFTMMVLMAIATTLPTAPVLRWLLRSDAGTGTPRPESIEDSPSPRLPSDGAAIE